MMKINKAERIQNLPPYLFAEIDRMKDEVKKQGVAIIDLGVGDPDLPTNQNIIDKLAEACQYPENHRYPSYSGMDNFRISVANWYQKRFGVKLNHKTEVVSLIGSKEGIAHIPLAFVDPKEVVLVPSPAYPVYQSATIFAGGVPFEMPLLKENHFLPDLSIIPPDQARAAKLMFLNYPNNPTSAVAEKEFFEEVIEFAQQHQIIVCHDAAYTELFFDGYRPISFLEVAGAKEVGIEFHSLSKTYNMTGWRIGFAVGNREIIEGLGKVKTNIDSGIFQAVQYAGIEALEGDQSWLDGMRKIYRERRDLLCSELKRIGLQVEKPKATFYLWITVPKRETSIEFAARLLNKAGVVTTPGVGLGKYGEGYIRMALTVDTGKIAQAIERIEKIL